MECYFLTTYIYVGAGILPTGWEYPHCFPTITGKQWTQECFRGLRWCWIDTTSLWTRQIWGVDAGEGLDLVDIPQLGGDWHGGGRLNCCSPCRFSICLQNFRNIWGARQMPLPRSQYIFRCSWLKLWTSLSFVCTFASEKWGELGRPWSRVTTPSLGREWNLQLCPTAESDVGSLQSTYMVG